MPKLTRYLSKQFLIICVSVTLAMMGLLSVLDTLSNGDLLPVDADWNDHLWFMLLRAPILFEQILSFALLLSLLITYVLFIRRNELVAIVAAGLSAWRQIAALLPVVIAVSLLCALFVDQVAPRAQVSLVNWLGLNAVSKDKTRADELWLADGANLVRIATVDKGQLIGVTLFERKEKGKIASVSHAQSATAEDGGWRLNEVTQERFDNQPVALPEFWETKQTPYSINQLTLEPRYLTSAVLWRLANLRQSGNRPSSAYMVWFYSRLAIPLMAVGFLIITVTIMQRFGRQAKPELMLVYAMGGGFIFAVLDSIAKTLPEGGGVNPALAAFTPVACLFAAGLVLSRLQGGRS